jgi:hypothetical protein
LPLRYRRVNGLLPSRARAISWWGLAQRRSTKSEGGVQAGAEGLAQAVGRPAEGAGAGEASGEEEEAEGLSAGEEEEDEEESGEVGDEGAGAGEPPQARARGNARSVSASVGEGKAVPTGRSESMGCD